MNTAHLRLQVLSDFCNFKLWKHCLSIVVIYIYMLAIDAPLVKLILEN